MNKYYTYKNHNKIYQLQLINIIVLHYEIKIHCGIITHSLTTQMHHNDDNGYEGASNNNNNQCEVEGKKRRWKYIPRLIYTNHNKTTTFNLLHGLQLITKAPLKLLYYDHTTFV